MASRCIRVPHARLLSGRLRCKTAAHPDQPRPTSRASILLGRVRGSAMHASHDFNSRRAHVDRVDVGELILDRGRSTGDTDPGNGELWPPRPRLRPRRGRLAVVALSILAVALACVLGVLLVIPLGWREQAIAGSILIAGAIALSRLSRSATVTMALMAVSLFATLRYGYWRAVQTWEGVTSAGHLREWD